MEFPEPIQTWLYERAVAKNTHELSLSDTLDVKAGILLAIITVLSSDPVHILIFTCAHPFFLFGESLFYALLVVGAFLTVLELWPRKYRSDTTPKKDEDWVRELHCHYAEKSGAWNFVQENITEAMFARLRDRVTYNGELNQKKIGYLGWSFRFISVSMAIYVLIAIVAKLG